MPSFLEPLFVKAGLASSQSYQAPTPTYSTRGVTFNNDDVAQLKKIMFSELSNRDASSKDLEGRVLFNTALNRQNGYQNAGKPRSLSEVLTEKNQYQGYNSPLYKQYDQGVNALTGRRRTEINALTDKLIKEVQNGTFKDVTNGAYYYKHDGKGKIYYDDRRPLFASK